MVLFLVSVESPNQIDQYNDGLFTLLQVYDNENNDNLPVVCVK